MLPVFVPESVARKVLLVGKSIDFVRLCCGTKSHDELAALLRPLALDAECFAFGREGNPESLREFVDAAATIVNKRLVHVLLTQHHLMTHMKVRLLSFVCSILWGAHLFCILSLLYSFVCYSSEGAQVVHAARTGRLLAGARYCGARVALVVDTSGVESASPTDHRHPPRSFFFLSLLAGRH
jgi:hypothetical protein